MRVSSEGSHFSVHHSHRRRRHAVSAVHAIAPTLSEERPGRALCHCSFISFIKFTSIDSLIHPYQITTGTTPLPWLTFWRVAVALDGIARDLADEDTGDLTGEGRKEQQEARSLGRPEHHAVVPHRRQMLTELEEGR